MTPLNSDLTIPINKTLFDAMAAINSNTCEVVFVINDGGKVEGVVTDGDIRRALLSGMGFETPLSAVMKRNFISVREGTDRNAALDLMKARTIRHLPILDMQGTLKGVHLLRELIGAKERPNPVVILAGGRGSRLGNLTDDLPKPMLKVADRPILERIVLHLIGSGLRKIYLSVNYKAQVIKEHFGDGSEFGCEIQYLHEEMPLGTAGPLSLLPPVDHPVLVMNGDLVVQFDVENLLSFHETGRHQLSLCARQHQIDIPYGVISQREGVLYGIEEKPTKSFLISAGIYAVNPSILADMTKARPLDMPDLISSVHRSGKSVGVYQIDADWIDVGRHEDLSRAKGLVWS